MSWIPLVVLFWCAWSAWRLGSKGNALEQELREQRYLLSRLKGQLEDDREKAGILRAHVAAMASGQKVSREQVLKGQFYSEISALEAYDRYKATPGTALVDVRSGEEWLVDHATGAVHIPLDQLPNRLADLPAKEVPVLLICASGGRSAQAAEWLATQGWTDVSSVRGGTPAWPGPHEVRTMMKLGYAPPAKAS